MKEIEQLLKIIAQHDLRDEYIAPEPNRGKEIGEVIAKEVGAFFEDLCIEDRTGKTEKDIKYSFSARPSDFVRDALKSIDKAIKELKKMKAEKIDLVFHNDISRGNEWGDVASIAIRYTKKS